MILALQYRLKKYLRSLHRQCYRQHVVFEEILGSIVPPQLIYQVQRTSPIPAEDVYLLMPVITTVAVLDMVFFGETHNYVFISDVHFVRPIPSSNRSSI